MSEKADIRREIRARKRGYTDAELRDLSHPIMERLLAHERILSADVVLMYYALPDEVYTADALQCLLDKGKRVLLPTVVGDEDLELYEFLGEDSLHEGAFHIMEPSGVCFKAYNRIDVAVVPGMAFDGSNNRLGRGKGYYDRFLAKIPAAYKIGVCFDFQKVASIPADRYDIRMDEVL